MSRLVAGVRFESTHVDTRSFNSNTGQKDFTAGGNYTDVLPSASLKFATTPNTSVRLVYSRALSRPDPQDISQAVGPVNDTQNPPTVSLGNPNLKAEHANNFDILLEQYLSPLGLIQAGYFYKALADPIIATQTRPTSGPYAGFLVSQPGNAGSATLAGFRVRLSAAPDVPARSACPGWACRRTTATRRPKREGCRCAPTNRRCSGRRRIRGTSARPTIAASLSVRVGMSYNGANIFAYQYQNLNSDGTPMTAGDLTAGGQTGPGGDSYLYPHFQLDAQATVRVATRILGRGLRSEPDERGVRVLQRQPAVRRAARVLQADVRVRHSIHTAVAVAAVTLNGS